MSNDENTKKINSIKPENRDQDPTYDAKLISTSGYYDTTKYEELGIVVGSATQGISLTKTFFSGIRAMIGSRVTNIEDSFTRGFGFAVQHMIQNASSDFPRFKKIIGMFWSMSALNPESISILVTGTAIGLKSNKRDSKVFTGGKKTKKRGGKRKRKTIRL